MAAPTTLVQPPHWARNLGQRLNSLRQQWLTPEKRAPLFFTASSITLSVSQMICGILLVRWILPKELGLWQAVYLAQTYAYFLLAGTNNGLNRELPYSLGKGETETGRVLTGTAQFVTTLGSFVILLAGAGTWLFLGWQHSDAHLLSAVAAVTLLIICSFYRNFLTVTFRSQSSFIDLSRIQVLEAALMIASLPLVYFLRYNGMLMRLVVVSGLVLYWMYRLRPMKVAMALDWKSLKHLLRTGTPIFALDYLRTCSGTLPSVALLHFGGVQQVGYFALAATASTAFEVIPNAVAQYVYPRMSYVYGREGKASALWGPCWKTTVVLIFVTVPLAVLGWFCLPPVIAMFFPNYVPSTRATQLMLFSIVGSALAVCANALWSLKAWTSIVTYQVASAALIAAAPFVAPRLGVSPLVGVASGILGARLLSGVIALALVYRITREADQ